MYDYESYYEPDEPKEDVVAAFEKGKKAMTVRRYERRPIPPVEAMQWRDDNKDEVLAWLASLEIKYTHHEIRSADELYIYLNGGPVMVYLTDYIVKIGSSNDVLIFGEKNFVETWTPISNDNR